MSTKGLRHHMVMNAHHHRWATRRTVSATQNLKKNHAVHVPVHKGKRVKQSQQYDQVYQKKNTNPIDKGDAGRGSFDAFFATQFGGPKEEPSSSSTQQPPKTPKKQTKIQSNPYSPHLFTSLEHLSQFDQGDLGQDEGKYEGQVWIPSIPSLQQSQTTNTHNNNIAPIFVPPTDIQLQPVHAYFADIGLPCGSVHNTLSHLYAAEKLWQHRWTKTIPNDHLTKLWSEQYKSNDFQWSEYCSNELNLPIINIDSTEDMGSPLTNQTTKDKKMVKNILSMSLDEQSELALHMMNKISFALDDQNTLWISLIQGTTEPDLFNDLSYFDTSYKPSRLGNMISAEAQNEGNSTIILEDFETDKAKLSSMPRLVALNHLFMHATHHRSQMLTVASQFTGEQTVVDLSAFVPEWKQIHSKVFRWA